MGQNDWNMWIGILNSRNDWIKWVGMIGICGLEYSIVRIEYLIAQMIGLGGSELNIIVGMVRLSRLQLNI